MPFNGSGTYAAPALPGSFNPATVGGSATNTDWNTLLTDLSTALSTCVTKDGQTTISANIPMASHKFTGLANGTAFTDSAAIGQVWSVISTTTPVAASSIDFPNVATTYKHLMVEFEFLPGTNAVDVGVQFYDSAGVLDTAAVYQYALQLVATTPTTGSAGASANTSILLNGGSNKLSSTATFGISGRIDIQNIQATRFTRCTFQTAYVDTNPLFLSCTGSGMRGAAGNITGLNIFTSSGTITGYATLYGAI